MNNLKNPIPIIVLIGHGFLKTFQKHFYNIFKINSLENESLKFEDFQRYSQPVDTLFHV